METVNKGPEPAVWRNYRNTPGADFSATKELQLELLKEGGFVCAYCGRRIPCQDPLPDIASENPADTHAAIHRADTMHVEHFWPRELMHSAAQRMDYRNLIACCPGFISKIGFGRNVNRYSSHCDHRKGSRVLHLDIFQQNLGDRFTYNTNVKSPEAGAIRIEGEFLHSPDPDEKAWLDTHRPGWDDGHTGRLKVNLQNEIAPLDIRHDDNVLNLNHKLLMSNRAAVIKAIQSEAAKYGNQRAWWEKLLVRFSSMNQRIPYLNHDTNTTEYHMAYPPYRSIAIYYIKKKLRQFS